MAYQSSRRLRTRRHVSISHARQFFTLSRFIKYGFFLLIALIILVPILFFWYSRDLPKPGQLVTSQHSDATRIYDRHGTLLYSVYQDENRTYVTLDKIPKLLQESTIAIEDKDFYKNEGFSPIAYLRVVKNYATGQGLGGGSTITQQLVKNVLLEDSRRVLSRKIKELILAIQVNQTYSKDQILEMYLNNIPYGGTAVGVEAASEQYFGKSAKDLDLGQSAFLAGLPQNPSIYTPFSGNKYYLARTKAVLKQLVSDGYATQAQSDKAYKEIANYQFSQKDGTIKAPHFVMYVKQKLAEQFGEQMVTTGGLQVTTTLDYPIEKKTEDIVKSQIGGLKATKVTNGAAIVEDPKTGEVLAMDGSADYFDQKNDGNFNAAIAQRQPGSSLKPIMYATAFTKGYTPATLIMDVQTNFPTGVAGQPDYSPVNYDGKFHGPVQVRYALANSFNIPAVKMLAKVGITPVMQQAYDMGIENWNPTPQNRASVGLSLVLGGRETSLLSEVTAYGVFANEGIRQDPVTILKVTDSRGKVLYQHDPTPGKRVLSDAVSFLISHILLDNSARTLEFGPNSALVVPGHTISVKTGTTDEKRDNWTVGYTSSYVVGVWVGNNDNSPMSQTLASGITGAAPIWNAIMSSVLKGRPDEQPKKPDNVVAVQVDGFAGGLPHAGQPTRSEYFIKGTEPTAESPVYQSKDGKNYIVIRENDPVSTDGVNRWQAGIDAWIAQNHGSDELWHPSGDVIRQATGDHSQDPTPTPTPGGDATPTPTPDL
ncbi:MAG: transglycosylase domain-containing protein [Candidatus Levyibacteriota bacterium]